MEHVQIVHERDNWLVTSKDGSKVFGIHNTKHGAIKQLNSIESRGNIRIASPRCDYCDDRVVDGTLPIAHESAIGTIIFAHPPCWTKLRPKSGAPSFTLTCDHCGDTVETGDDNETDPNQSVGDLCFSCGKGTLSYRSSNGTKDPEEETTTRDVLVAKAVGYTFTNPDNAEDLQSAQQDAMKEPRKAPGTSPSMRSTDGDDTVRTVTHNNDAQSVAGQFYPDPVFRNKKPSM